MMRPPFFYCSEVSRRAAERTYGTASTGDVWLLVEYPYWWGAKAFSESTLSPALKSHLNRALKTIPRARLLFIKQDRMPGRAFTVFVVRCRETNPSIMRLDVKDHDELLGIDLASTGESMSDGASKHDNPLYLVCTHGRRDKCCAKFGYPLYKSLKKYTGDNVWQSSHVGGDRFAANLVCFPHGLFYAHVTEEAGANVIDEYGLRRRLVLDKYRGRACYSHPAQAAEFFIRREAAINGLDDLRYLDYVPVDERVWRVHFASTVDGRIHEAKVRGVMSEFQSYVTCHSMEEKSVIQYSLDDYRCAG